MRGRRPHKGELRPRGQPVHRPSGRGRSAALRPSPSHQTTMFHGTDRPRTHTSTFTATNLAIAGLARTGGIRAVVRAPHRRADEGGPALGRVRANLAFAKFVAVNVDVWVLGLPHGRRREQPIAEAAVQCHGEYPLGVEVERPRRRRWTQRCAKTWPHCTVASLAAAMAAPRRAFVSNPTFAVGARAIGINAHTIMAPTQQPAHVASRDAQGFRVRTVRSVWFARPINASLL